MENERIELDSHHFDYIILGTDLPESILSASLSHRGLSCLNIDADHLYSGTLKSVNFRELARVSEDLETSFKDHLIRDFRFESLDSDFSSLAQASDTLGFRSVNFDLEPKLILSDGRATSQLVLVGVDDYISFRPVKDLSVFMGGELQPLPLTKSLLLKTKGVSFKHKKEVIEKIELLQKFVQSFLEEKDLNSTKEFEKEIYTLEAKERFQQLFELLDSGQEQFFSVFFAEQKPSERPSLAENLIKYVLCGIKKMPDGEKTTAREMLSRFSAFIRSAGVHDVYPYLYPIYGIGDLSQVFSRLGALNGGIFLINPAFLISAVSRPEKEDGHFQLELKQAEFSYTLFAKNIIAGQQYKQKLKQLLCFAKNEENYEACEKIIVVCRSEANNGDFEYPMLAVFPPESESLGNENPVNVFLFGPNTQTTKDGFFCLHFSCVKSKDNSNFLLRKKLDEIIFLLNESKKMSLKPLFLVSFDRLYERNERFEFPDKGVVFAPSYGSELTIEKCFQDCHQALREMGVAKSESEPLVVRKQMEVEGSVKTREQKIIEELEAFKFD